MTRPNFRLARSSNDDMLFASPYRPTDNNHHNASPPSSSAPTGADESGSSSPKTSFEHLRTDSQTPLLPPTPTHLEKGGASCAFPSRARGTDHHHHHQRSWGVATTRMRYVIGQIRGAALYRRICYLVIVVSVMGILVLRADTSISALAAKSPSYVPERDHLRRPYDDDGTIGPATPSPPTSRFRFPSIPLPYISFGKPKSDLPQLPEGPTDTGVALAQTRLSSSSREADLASEPLPLNATLQERLEAWKNAPGGRGNIEGEVEHGTFVQWNLEQCSNIAHQHNTHMIQHSALVWATQNRTSLNNQRMELIRYMQDVVIGQDLVSQYGRGRGIVMVAGNADTLERVKWSLQMLRSYGSQLPVMIFHFPSEAPADDDPIREELAELGAELKEAKGQSRDEGKNKSYHLKALAVVQCPWREVLYLDSDSIPVRDPEYMFDAPNYRRLGLWATPDYWKTSATNPMWAIMGVKCRNEWEMETGQMFVDKKRHLDVWLLVQYMLERHGWWFYYSDGDKDIFRWAMLALRKRWGVPGRWVGAAALPYGTMSGDFCAHTMLQHDSWGEPLFVHYNLLKQIPSGVGRGYSWGQTKQLPLFNTFPAWPSTARLGEPTEKPQDDGLPGLGDVDCDMLADADETGRARAPAKDMIMRRAVREHGVKVRYHGGSYSALCIDIDYVDPRPPSRRHEDAAVLAREEAEEAERNARWAQEHERIVREHGPAEDMSAKLAALEAQRVAEEERVDAANAHKPVRPDWTQSPLEVVSWDNDPHLRSFENTIFDYGFRPNGQGF